MKRFGCILSLCILTVLVRLPVAARQENPPLDRWLRRSEQLTHELLKDSAAMSDANGALVLARLAQAWWRVEPERARKYIAQAIEAVTGKGVDEPAAERQLRLTTMRVLLRLVVAVEPKSGEKLMALLESESARLSASVRAENADALVETALSLLERAPLTASRLGSTSLRMGVSHRFSALLWQLRSRDRALADALFLEALGIVPAAQGHQQRNLTRALLHVAFNGPSPSEAIRRRTLEVVTDSILNVPAATGAEVGWCSRVGDVAPLLGHYARLLPRQEPHVQAAVARCRAQQGDNPRRASEEPLRREPPDSVDELLEAASGTSDARLRNDYLLRAVNLAAEQGEYERAVEILDSVRLDERVHWGDSWATRRWSYAAEVAYAQIKRADYQKMYRTLDAVAPEQRPFAQLLLANRMLKSGERNGALELVREARKNMARVEPRAAGETLLSVVRLYAELLPAEAGQVLDEAVKAINRAAHAPRAGDDEAAIPILTNEILLSSYRLPASLLEVDEAGVRNSVSSIEPSDKRVAVRLFLLADALGHVKSTEQSEKPPQVLTDAKQSVP